MLGVRLRFSDTQLEGQAADESHGAGQCQETGSVCTSVAVGSCHRYTNINGG